MEKHKTNKKEKPEEPEESAPESPEETITLTKKDWQSLSEQAAKADESRDHLLRLAAEFEIFAREPITRNKDWLVLRNQSSCQNSCPSWTVLNRC